jgi:hypothetical protein
VRYFLSITILLAVLLPIFGLPVPPPEDAYEAISMWFAMLYFGVPLGAILIATGVALRKAVVRLRTAAR